MENAICLNTGSQGVFLFRFLTVFRTVYTANNEYGCGHAGLNVATESNILIYVRMEGVSNILKFEAMCVMVICGQAYCWSIHDGDRGTTPTI